MLRAPVCRILPTIPIGFTCRGRPRPPGAHGARAARMRTRRDRACPLDPVVVVVGTGFSLGRYRTKRPSRRPPQSPLPPSTRRVLGGKSLPVLTLRRCRNGHKRTVYYGSLSRAGRPRRVTVARMAVDGLKAASLVITVAARGGALPRARRRVMAWLCIATPTPPAFPREVVDGCGHAAGEPPEPGALAY